MALVPAGLGKSRIALAAAHLFAQHIATQSSTTRLNVTRIVFVYTTVRLMEVESEGFTKISLLLEGSGVSLSNIVVTAQSQFG